MATLRKNWLQWLVHLAALAPLVWLIWDYANQNLSINPIQDITSRTGKPAIILLVLSLACTPINTVFGLKRVIAFRKPLGLYAFLYVSLHLLTFGVLDYQLDWGLISEAVTEKRFVLVGFTAFLLLVPLAITSTKGWQKRLGKNWKQLHKLVYLIAPLAVLHYVWLVKADIRQPLLFGVAVALLLLLRVPPVRRAITTLRSRLFPKPAPKAAANVTPRPQRTPDM